MHELLPSNAASAERAFSDVLDSYGRLQPELRKVRTLTLEVDDIPDDWLPWVVIDEGLDDLIPYLPSLRQVLSEGRQWKRERGSADAILRALSWMGITGAALHYEPDEDQRFDLFQVELPGSIPVSDIPKLIALVELSKPTTDLLGRVYGGNAGGVFRLDHSTLDGPDRLDHWDGVNLPGIKPPVYFNDQLFSEVTLEPMIAVCLVHAACSCSSEIVEGFMLDISQLDEEIVEPATAMITHVMNASEVMTANLNKGAWVVDRWPGYEWEAFSTEVFYYGDHSE